MKKTYLVIAFGLSILLFAGVFMGSFDHYRLKQKSRSPFLNAIALEETISTESNKIKTLLMSRRHKMFIDFTWTSMDAHRPYQGT